MEVQWLAWHGEEVCKHSRQAGCGEPEHSGALPRFPRHCIGVGVLSALAVTHQKAPHSSAL